MRRTVFLISTAIVALCSLGLLAQAPANFAGTWTLVPDANAAPGGGRGGGFGGLGTTAMIAQDAATVTITRTTQMGEMKSVYKLDGSKSVNTLSFGGNEMEQASTAKWDGATLVVVTSSDFGGNAFETTMVLSLDASGGLMVESTRPDFQGGGAPVVTKQTYKKG